MSYRTIRNRTDDVYKRQCVMCAGAIGWAQLARVVFGAGDEKRGYRRFAPQVLHPKTAVECGVLAGECIALMKDFFAKKR